MLSELEAELQRKYTSPLKTESSDSRGSSNPSEPTLSTPTISTSTSVATTTTEPVPKTDSVSTSSQTEVKKTVAWTERDFEKLSALTSPDNKPGMRRSIGYEPSDRLLQKKIDLLEKEKQEFLQEREHFTSQLAKNKEDLNGAFQKYNQTIAQYKSQLEDSFKFREELAEKYKKEKSAWELQQKNMLATMKKLEEENAVLDEERQRVLSLNHPLSGSSDSRNASPVKGRPQGRRGEESVPLVPAKDKANDDTCCSGCCCQ